MLDIIPKQYKPLFVVAGLAVTAFTIYNLSLSIKLNRIKLAELGEEA